MNNTTLTTSAPAASVTELDSDGKVTPVTDADAVIADLREQLNAVDAEVIAAVTRRLELSRQIQAVRMSAGGPRREHSRELKIMNRYSAGLGDGGSTLALTLLEMCRGRA